MNLLQYHKVFFPYKRKRGAPIWQKHINQKKILEYYKGIGYNKPHNPKKNKHLFGGRGINVLHLHK